MSNAFIYCRISDDKHEGAGVQRQEQACRELADRLGLTVSAVYVDNSVSAVTGDRKEYRAMLQAVERGEVRNIITWESDRLYRKARDLEPLIDLLERTKTTLHTVNSGELDLSTANGRLVARLLASVSTHEVEHLKERTIAAHRSRAQLGTWRGGSAPYGFRLGQPGHLEHDPAEAPVVRSIFRQFLEHGQVLTIARALKEQGTTTRRGGAFSARSLRHILNNPAVAGLTSYKGEEPVKAVWEGIVSEDDYWAALAILRDPARRTSQGNERRYQGSGVYLCGTCGQPVSVTQGKGGRRRTVYTCKGPGHVVRDQERVDELIDSIIVTYLASQRLSGSVRTDDDSGDLTSERARLIVRQSEAAEAFAGGRITLAQLETINERLSADLERIDAALADQRQGSVLAALDHDDIAASWAALQPDQRARIIGMLMRVTINPTGRTGRHFEPTSVGIEWKGAGEQSAG